MSNDDRLRGIISLLFDTVRRREIMREQFINSILSMINEEANKKIQSVIAQMNTQK